MSRGIGKLQREILRALPETKHRKKRAWENPFTRTHSVDVIVADNVFDLREVLKYLSGKLNKFTHCSYVSPRFQASFSRAIKSLIKRGLLIKYSSLVPLKEVENESEPYCPSNVHRLSDGLYLLVNKNAQIRFVSLGENGQQT